MLGGMSPLTLAACEAVILARSPTLLTPATSVRDFSANFCSTAEDRSFRTAPRGSVASARVG